MTTDTRALTVGALIDERPLSRFQIRVIALCGLIMILDGFDALSLGFLAPAIADHFAMPLSTLGPVFAGSLFGLMISGMASGPIADRYGRKWVIVISTLTFASFAILSARATSVAELVLWRFLTGLGLGGAMSNVVALASEYMPKRRQFAFVAALFCGMPIGALLGGMLSTVLIPIWGWRSVLYVGGFLPFIVAMLSIKLLPESIRYLAARRGSARRIDAIVRQIAPDVRGVWIDLAVPGGDIRTKLPIKHLFTEGRAIGTVLLWVAFFMNLLILYFVASWLPGLLRQGGMPVSAGIAALSLFSVGGIIGKLLQGQLIAGPYAGRALAIEFAISAGLIALLAFTNGSTALTMTLTLILGISVQGAQAGLNGVAASYYPTAIRATGVGWASGIGRAGSIIGPTLGGVLLSMQWTPKQIFLAATLPALTAATAAFMSEDLIDGN